MSLLWRRVLFVLVLLLASVVGVAFWAFRATRANLERAEAFQFQRMQVTRLDDVGTHRYYYATNRVPGASGGRADDRFGRERAEELSFGSFDARVEPSVGLRSLFDAGKWFRDDEIDLLEERSLERATFVEDLGALVRRSPRQTLLIVVHGYREAFASALRKTAFIGQVLDVNTPVLLFDWPGDQRGGPVAAYRRAFEVADASGPDLAETLALVLKEVAPQKVWLIANSMGGQVVAQAFSVLYADEEFADAELEFEDVVLTAPDIGLEEFDQQFKDEISALARSLTVYVSSNDRALLASRLLNRGRRRGESTLDSQGVSSEQLDEALALADLIEPDSGLITLVDVTPVNRTRNFHNFYLETPEVFDDLYLRLTNPANPRARALYPLVTSEGSVYWVLTRGR